MLLKNLHIFLFLLFLFQYNINAQISVITYSKIIDLKFEIEKLTGNGNDWEIVLYYNGFKNINLVPEGTKLKVPIDDLKKVNLLITESYSTIEKATAEGARVFSPITLDQSIKLIDDTKILLKSGKLNEAIASGLKAKKIADLTYSTTKSLRVTETTAKLAEYTGNTEFRTPEDSYWRTAKLQQEFKEKNKVRTLSNSEATILFKDESRIHMGENSLTVIEQLKTDKLVNSQNSKITVLQGGFLAFLNQSNERNNFGLEVPGVETEVKSENFFTSRDEKGTARFANYAGVINLKSAGKKVSIKKNEGSIIEKDKAPSDPVSLLPPPEIIEPLSKKIIYGDYVDIKWKAVKNALAYRIDIAKNFKFTEELRTKYLDKTSYRLKVEKSGVYYFRISSIDKGELPGSASEPLSTSFKLEKIAPYLLVETDKRNKTVSDSIKFVGQVDPNAVLLMNDKEISFSENGSFKYVSTLNAGRNLFTFIAKYPNGLFTRKEFSIEKVDKSDVVKFKDFVNLINTPIFYLKGKTFSQTTLSVNNRFLEIDSLGQFASRVNLDRDKEIKISGKVENYSFSKDIYIGLDTTKPVIKVDSLPHFTFNPIVQIKGNISEACNVWINGDSVLTTNCNFITPIKLKQGWNEIEIRARDDASNVEISKFYVEHLPEPKIISVINEPSGGNTGQIIAVNVNVNDEYNVLPRSAKAMLYDSKGILIGNGIITKSAKGKYYGSLVLSKTSQKISTRVEFKFKDKVITNK